MGLSSLEVHLGLSLLGSPSVFDKSWRGGVVMGWFTIELGRMGSFTCGPIGRGLSTISSTLSHAALSPSKDETDALKSPGFSHGT